MTSTNPNQDRIVRTPCGEDIHLDGLTALLRGIWGISTINPEVEAVEKAVQPMGPDALETMIVGELGGIAAHPPIEAGSNVVSIFKNR